MNKVAPAKIKLMVEYRNPTPAHCDLAVWVNGGFAGMLRLRQEEISTFQDLLINGMDAVAGDEVLFKGSADYKPKQPK